MWCRRSSSSARTSRCRAHERTRRGAGLDELFTVGHSTRSLDELVALLNAAGVRRLVDIRTVPRSRRHPHFAGDALAESLPVRGIAYQHEPDLGGFRRPHPDSPNRGWEHQAFRGYADYMATQEFGRALQRLEGTARREPTTIMCAEAQWWRCHRRLVSDALTVRGWRVRHLGPRASPAAPRAEPIDHELTPFLVVGDDGSLEYPAAQTELEI